MYLAACGNRQAEPPRIQLQQPIGDVRGAFEFVWTASAPVERFQITVRDATRAVMFTLAANTARTTVPAALRRRLKDGEQYSWYVEALDYHGTIVSGSATGIFTIQP